MDQASAWGETAMMTILDRYIAKEVIFGSLVAVTVLLSLLTFFTFADELGDMGKGNYGMREIAKYLALTIPRSFYELLPTASLVGSLVTLGGLANNRELVAMKASGVSEKRIIGAVLIGGLALLMTAISVGELIAPPAERNAQNLKSLAQNNQVTSRSKYGFWVRDGDTFINIRKIQEHQSLGDISIYNVTDERKLDRATHAEKAVHDGNQWKLDQLRITHFDTEQITAETNEAADWTSVLAPDLLNAFVIRPENLSAWELYSYMQYLNENGQTSLIVEQAFWGRLINPFSTLVMLLMAVPFVLNIRREVGMGQRIVLGSIIGLGFYLFDKMFAHLGLVYEFNPIFAVSFPSVLALSGVVFVLWRIKKTN